MNHNFELVPMDSSARSEMRTAETHWRETLKTRVATAKRKAKPRVPRARKRFLVALIGACVLGAAFVHNAHAESYGHDRLTVNFPNEGVRIDFDECFSLINKGTPSPFFAFVCQTDSFSPIGPQAPLKNSVDLEVFSPRFTWYPMFGFCREQDESGVVRDHIHYTISCVDGQIFSDGFGN